MTAKTHEEIEQLKKSWKHDPIWDIEDTEGFEEYHDELLAWRKEYEAEREKIAEERDNKRIEKVMLATGVRKADRETLLSLNTFWEVENSIDIDNYVGDCGDVGSFAAYCMAQAQIRATLLQAAQLKRIADALEQIADQDDGSSLINSAKIWGSEL